MGTILRCEFGLVLLSAMLIPACAPKKEIKLELSREIVSTQPEIKKVSLNPSGRQSTRDGGLKVEVMMVGDPELQATFDIESRLEGGAMRETEPGVYVGQYDVPKGDMGTLKVTGHLLHPPTKAHALKQGESTLELYTAPDPTVALAQGEACDAMQFEERLESLTVRFDFNESDLRTDGRELLSSHRDVLASSPRCAIQLHGHSDEIGSEPYNDVLSEKRAAEVRAFLVSLGIPEKRMQIHSFGKRIPADPSHSKEAHARNRRVELHAGPAW